MPGKPIQSLKTTGCSNPLILIDEVSKIRPTDAPRDDLMETVRLTGPDCCDVEYVLYTVNAVIWPPM